MVKKRFFVHQTRQNQERERSLREYTSTCSVLDRETVIDGKYKVIQAGIQYLDAWTIANKMNATHQQS